MQPAKTLADSHFILCDILGSLENKCWTNTMNSDWNEYELKHWRAMIDQGWRDTWHEFNMRDYMEAASIELCL